MNKQLFGRTDLHNILCAEEGDTREHAGCLLVQGELPQVDRLGRLDGLRRVWQG